MPLNEKALAFSGGILWGLTIFGTTMISAFTGYAQSFLQAYGSLHPGYSITIAGAFIGLAYAFACATVGLYIFAKLYNYMEKKL